MEDKKGALIKKCIDLSEKAEKIIECPICCILDAEVFVQCVVGHHICQDCWKKLNNVCPICKKNFTGTKCFLAQDVAKIIGNFKTLLILLDQNDTTEILKHEDYRKMVKALLNKLSTFFNKFSTSLLFLSDYVHNPIYKNQNELETQLTSLTSQMQNIKLLMNETEKNFKSLK